MRNDNWPILIVFVLALAGFVAIMSAIAGGKQGVKDMFGALGWMWLLIAAVAAVVIMGSYITFIPG
ncbi:hypothetical protein [Mesorhizobium sp.]|uniref:hypothetical protein n=1 Tax=Mesorhizobium sp. TaxID=1871066 RepID=UPI000FE72E0F|nr:hypothetical protein [Mesorhizobium sp.]RWP30226.1 MAG: hypothetical protein EOR03_24805 [Mesorhizobium sp.]TIL63718.1 MAG: hypothetical protein E5Y77_30490 [Mesorhizobium sp.]